MHNFTKVKLNLFILLLGCVSNVFSQGSETNMSDNIWEAIGGKDNWKNARYFMFSCSGGHNRLFTQGKRTYLWDKQDGDCRFEGITTDDESILALFNVKTLNGSVYLNGEKLSNPKTTADVIKEVSTEFEQDASLIFLPTVLEGDHVSFSVTSEKLIGSQRFTVMDIKNPKTSFETAVDGQLYVDAQTGRLHQWLPNDGQHHYTIGGFKDIGGGLILPTRFIANDSTENITYPLAAALVNIEAQKFSSP